ncbi:MAG: hypothetical protein AAF611_07930 [Bacteroidota bacterium]
MKKLKSLKDFAKEKKNVLTQKDTSLSIRGGIGGGNPTTTSSEVSTDLGPNRDTDCGTQLYDDNGNEFILIVDKESLSIMGDQ